MRSRGTNSSPADTIDGDRFGGFYGAGYNSGFDFAVGVTFYQDGAINTQVPTKIIFETQDDVTNRRPVSSIDGSGNFNILLDNAKLNLGAGKDASLLYDGTDLVINSSEVGSGTIKLNSANNWTANGTNAVTISNVAPSGVGTATISKWLTVKDDSGTVYYIPVWT